MSVKELREEELARKYPNLDMEDRIIRGAIDVYEGHGWSRMGWSGNDGQDVCILESLNVSKYGAKKSSEWGLSKKLISRVHRAIYGDDYYSEDRGRADRPTKRELALEVMDWNDTGGKGDKKQVVRILKKALNLGS